MEGEKLYNLEATIHEPWIAKAVLEIERKAQWLQQSEQERKEHRMYFRM